MEPCKLLGILRGARAGLFGIGTQPSLLGRYALLSPLVLGLLSVPAWAQAVTAADLVGIVMKVSVTNDRVIRREGQEFLNKYQTDWTINFVSDNTIRPFFIGTDYNPRSISKSPVEGGRLVVLGQQTETRSRGGGQLIWAFDAGALTYLRTYEAGAMKATFPVSRRGADFSCTASV